MLAYAAKRPVAGKRESSPNALLVVISVHVALLAVVMSAKMDVPGRIMRSPPLINVAVMTPPPPNRPQPKQPQPQLKTHDIDQPVAKVPVPRPDPQPNVATSDPTSGAVALGGGGTAVLPEIPQPLPTAPIHHDPRLLTPASDLKPPYPAAKLAAEQEATLRLRLTIDDRGRVIAVDPVGYADRAFLESARRYIIAHWRYDPASDGPRAVASTITVTLRFQFDG